MKPTGRQFEVELRAQRDEAEPGNPHSTAKLVTESQGRSGLHGEAEGLK